MEPKCPNCGLNNDIHTCIIFKPDKTIDFTLYHCNICGFDWDASEEPQKEEPSEPTAQVCFWCSHYKSALSQFAPESSFIVAVRPVPGGPIKAIDPTYCPFCGEKLLKEKDEK